MSGKRELKMSPRYLGSEWYDYPNNIVDIIYCFSLVSPLFWPWGRGSVTTAAVCNQPLIKIINLTMEIIRLIRIINCLVLIIVSIITDSLKKEPSVIGNLGLHLGVQDIKVSFCTPQILLISLRAVHPSRRVATDCSIPVTAVALIIMWLLHFYFILF